MKKRILFICESVSLAHLTRTASLIEGLDPRKFDVTLATGHVPEFLTSKLDRTCTRIELRETITPEVFARHLAKGSLPFTSGLVERQVQEDLRLLHDIKPDLVVGDFRLSLAISARIAGIRYLNVSNATWDPTADLGVQVPDLPVVRLFGERLSQRIFSVIRPFLLRRLARPFNSVAERHGRSPIGSLFDVYTDGDIVFYADLPGLVATKASGSKRIVAGPILTSVASGALPLPFASSERPLVLVSLGSTGSKDAAEKVVEAIRSLPITIMVSSAGADCAITPSENVFVSSYLQLDKLLPQASLLVFNGGSASGYLGLSHGVPLLAIPSNLDQANFTAAIEPRGASLKLRIEELSRGQIRAAVEKILGTPGYRQAAERLKTEISRSNSVECFKDLVREQTFKPVRSSPTKPKILITGGRGFVGQHLAMALPSAILSQSGKHDFFRLETLRDLLTDVDTVVHLAATNAGAGYNPSPHALMHNNLDLTAQLIRGIRHYAKKKPKVIFLSTIHVYEAGQELLRETTPIGPASLYGAIKYSQETLLRQAAEEGLIDLVVFRATHIYGPNAKPNYNSAIATFCYKALKGEPIDLYANGMVLLDLIHVRDVVKYIRLAAENTSLTGTHTFNLASGHSVTLIAVVKTLESALGRRIETRLIDKPAAAYAIDVRRLRSVLGLVVHQDLAAALKEQLQAMADKSPVVTMSP